MTQKHFLTVSWCKGPRGIFCNDQGKGYWLDRPHTRAEMDEILGPFWMILSPESTVLTEEQVAQHTQWTPLAEHSGQFGIAVIQ